MCRHSPTVLRVRYGVSALRVHISSFSVILHEEIHCPYGVCLFGRQCFITHDISAYNEQALTSNLSSLSRQFPFNMVRPNQLDNFPARDILIQALRFGAFSGKPIIISMGSCKLPSSPRGPLKTITWHHYLSHHHCLLWFCLSSSCIIQVEERRVP